jgi:hypothetical protein
MITSRGTLLVAALAALTVLPAVGQPGFEFMPDGGRNLLRQLFAGKAAELAQMATESRDQAGWQSLLAERGALSPSEMETLAGYLSVNFPIEADADALAGSDDPVSLFPRDGKELAVANCQYCHAIFSGYLMHDRDVQGWRSVFLSPFHREIKMDEKERETFALYSAVNMPMKYEDVPPELRF